MALRSRPYAEIRLDALRRNFRYLQKRAGGVPVAAVVKANAYGLGAVPIARALQDLAAMFVVVELEEGVALQEAGIATPILLLGPLWEEEEIREAIRRGLHLTLTSPEHIRLIARVAQQMNQEARVHLEVDTGMARTGVDPRDLDQAIEYLRGSPQLRWYGFFTHFPNSSDLVYTREQVRRFRALLPRVPKGVRVHVANTGGVLGLGQEAAFDMIRPGIGLYGFPPSSPYSAHPLEPILTLKTALIHVRDISKGTGVSYNHTFVAPKDMRIGTVAIGYGDGFPRHLSNRGAVIIRGHRAPIVGTVCMDALMVDLSGVPEARPGDEVVVIGESGGARITAEEIADLAGTINYEIITRLAGRVRRIYKDA